jgi:hypothetical protein
MNSETIGNLVLRGFVVLLGILLTIPSVYKIGHYVFHSRRSIETVGEVVKSGRGMFLGCKPFIEFYAENQRKVVIKSNVNYFVFFCPEKGDKISLTYRKENPEIAVLSSNLHNVFIPAFFIIVGAFFLYSTVSGRIGKEGLNE